MFWVQVERFSRCSRSNGDGRRGKGENQKLDARSDIRWENTKLLLQTVGPQIHDRASQQSGSLSLQPTVFFAVASKNNADVCSLGCILSMQKRKADVVQCVLIYSIIANETVCTCCSQPKVVFILQKKKSSEEQITTSVVTLFTSLICQSSVLSMCGNRISLSGNSHKTEVNW